MPQLPLFESDSLNKWLSIPDGELFFDPNWLSPQEADDWMKVLMEEIAWEQREIQMFGKRLMEPRLTAWYGDAGMAYTYSGLTLQPLPWTDSLLQLKQQVEETADATFNSVLLNLYRDGQDSMGWHSDDEPELGENPVIASISLGEERKFHLRHRKDKSVETIRLSLGSGSLLIMAGSTQHFWQHQVPKTRRQLGVRINLTFRRIYQ